MAVSGLLHVCVRIVHGLRGHSVHKRWLDEIGGVQGSIEMVGSTTRDCDCIGRKKYQSLGPQQS